jgi:hypothetical protein
MKKTFEDFIDASDYIESDKVFLKEIFHKGREVVKESDKIENVISKKT